MPAANRPRIMGILNVTPDSFWDGGRYNTPHRALTRALEVQEQGADLIDVGAESTRPGSRSIGLTEERRRLIPVLKKCIPALNIPVCVDTTRADIVREALDLGARMINDTNALNDPGIARAVAAARADIILMHRKGASLVMQKNPAYRNCVKEILKFLIQRARKAQDFGIEKKHIWIDPGIGFGKRLEHNLDILRHLEQFCRPGYGVAVGLSRKSFLGALLARRRANGTTEEVPPADRLAGSLASAIAAVLRGADIVRVHDVKETAHAIKVLEAFDALKFNLSLGRPC